MPHALLFFLYIVVLAPLLIGQRLGGGWIFLFVLIPPIWFRMMNPREEALTAANPI